MGKCRSMGMKKLTCLALLCCTVVQLSLAQSYNTTAGMRLGTEFGVSVKQRIYESWTAEAILQADSKKNASAFSFIGVDHKAILSRRLNLFFGGGFHLPLQTIDSNKDGFGLVGATGLEFTIARLNFTWDYLPLFIPSSLSFRMQSAFSVRYVFEKRKKFSWETKNKKAFSLPKFNKNKNK